MAYEVYAEVIGPDPPGHAEFEADFGLFVAARMRQAVEQVRFAWQAKAQPSRRTGFYHDSIETSVDEVEGLVIGTVGAYAPYAEALEMGRTHSVYAADYGHEAFPMAVKGLETYGGGIPRGKGGKTFARVIGPFAGKHYGQRTEEETISAIQDTLAEAADEMTAAEVERRGGI